MNVWFGKHWGAAACEILDRVPTPTGAICPHCDEPIAADESGWGESPQGQWFHVECMARMLMGSIGHQLALCSCYDGDYEDPPTLTRREAAKAAFEHAQARGRRLEQPYVVCPRCGAVSHHPKDITERYCGRCHRFHSEG